MSLRCLKCGNIFLQTPTKFIGSQKDFCPICNNNTDEQTLSKEGAQQKIDKIFGEKKYEVMTYQNYKASCRLKHECGFEFTQRFDSFVHSVGCPKCVNRRSKGEEAIFQWLKDKNIHFKEQYKIEINDRRFYFDFFIPGYDLAIEYQGEQHYIDKPFFKETLEERTKRDTLKREYCHQHEIILLEIPYWELKNIPQILSLKLNDYLERE